MIVYTGRQLRKWRRRNGWDVRTASLWSGYSTPWWKAFERGGRQLPLPLIRRIQEFEWRREQNLPVTPFPLTAVSKD